jgi:hypothetical protein
MKTQLGRLAFTLLLSAFAVAPLLAAEPEAVLPAAAPAAVTVETPQPSQQVRLEDIFSPVAGAVQVSGCTQSWCNAQLVTCGDICARCIQSFTCDKATCTFDCVCGTC